MGNLNPRLAYIPRDYSNNPTIMSLVSSFRLVKPEAVLAIMNEKKIQEVGNYPDPPLWPLHRKIDKYIYNEYVKDQSKMRYEDFNHDCKLVRRLMEELKPYVTSMIPISPEIAKGVICLESDPTIQVKVEDVMRLMAYNTGLADATEE